ncbi:MAG: hypothetical protein CMC41_00705 [Flavobacteriaceae bacterium]|nr:hypothetical protein [Flavobacteriaceae bacterium]|tara:strand:- start:12018 stop:12527 length:510 start_codon:yes stop_codon:yes gene_type:complete
MKYNFFLISILFISTMWIFIRCEKDDICLDGTPGTPRLIIRFFDADSVENLKPTGALLVNKVEDSIDVYIRKNIFGTDSISIPLDAKNNLTELKFYNYQGFENENIDTLSFHYDRYDIYLNRACGFKGQFILKDDAVSGYQTSESWVKSYKIIKDSILDEKSMHLAIYH